MSDLEKGEIELVDQGQMLEEKLNEPLGSNQEQDEINTIQDSQVLQNSGIGSPILGEMLGKATGTPVSAAATRHRVVNFTINGKPYSVNPESESLDGLGVDSRLVDFIRNTALLPGTKPMCREGGCGSCVVTVTTKDPITGRNLVRSVNSCLTPVLSIDGWNIETVEVFSQNQNQTGRLHPFQKRLVDFSGTQCGFCTPGFVMNMYSLLKKKEKLTAKNIEDHFDGNLCRCTGYRPILDAAKSFAVDAAPELKAKCLGLENMDIEETCLSCPSKKSATNGEDDRCCSAKCCIPATVTHTGTEDVTGSLLSSVDLDEEPSISQDRSDLNLKITELKSGQQLWVTATNLRTAFVALNYFIKTGHKYRVVSGNTGVGLYKTDGPFSAFLDVNKVRELRRRSINKMTNDEDLVFTLGAGNSLNVSIDVLKEIAKTSGKGFAYALLATLGGNLMLKHSHPDFVSDVFLLFETIGAKINIASSPNTIQSYTLTDFLKLDMTGKLIISLQLPSLPNVYFRSFKIAQRHESTLADLNAGFLFHIDPQKNFKILQKPRIVFGGIRTDFYHAKEAERLLDGAELGNIKTLKSALMSIGKIKVDPKQPPEASSAYRRNLMKNVFYKTVLSILELGQGQVRPENRSGAPDLPRLLTRAQQKFDRFDDASTSSSESGSVDSSPLYKPVRKLEAVAQVSGKATYFDDMPEIPGELHGAFVLSNIANATLHSLDASEALKLPGVIRFIKASDIPGTNNNMAYLLEGEIAIPEPIFVEERSTVEYAGQALGLIVAVDQMTALKAAQSVRAEYTNLAKPILGIDAALAKAQADGTFDKILTPSVKSPKPPPGTPLHTIKGEFRIGGQAHVHMENQAAVCRLNERGIEIYSSTQWTDVTQAVIASAIGVKNNTINVQVRRLGGGFGSKITRASHTAAACAIASHLLQKPSRVILDMETNMKMVGKRFPFLINYEVGFNADGKVELLKIDFFCDAGAYLNELSSDLAASLVQSCYSAQIGWEIRYGSVKTNTHSNTYMRAPGCIKGIAVIELIMEQIAHRLQKDPIEVRRLNFIRPGDTLLIPAALTEFDGPNLVPELLKEQEKSGELSKRRAAVSEFNRQNRWRKRGLVTCPMRYVLAYYAQRYGVLIAIYHEDGSVAVSHAGIEMGQGLNTKVAQVVAYELGLNSVDNIEIKSSDNLIGANSGWTGGGMSSELVGYSALMAAKELKGRIERVRQANPELEKAEWTELIKACYEKNVDLRAIYFYTGDDLPQPYDIWALNSVEVEIDCLTGEFKILRSDLLQDAGKSLSPAVDIGQVEGAYVMGLGFWTTEKLVHDEVTGQLRTTNTTNYKVPFPKNIPEDFRVKLVSDRPNPLGVLSSKSTGEAPICMSITIFLALRNAIFAARHAAGNFDWFQMDAPVSPEDILRLSLTDSSQFSY